jgi:hypothetical protein
MNWTKDELNHDYLIESGLLAEINRQVLHPLGIGLAIKQNQAGEKSWCFKDFREEPEKATIPVETLKVARGRFVKFMNEFGNLQMKKRSKKLGSSFQHVEPNW